MSKKNAAAAETAPETTALATPLQQRLDRARNRVFVFEKREKMVPGKEVVGIFLGAGPYVWVEDPADRTKENRINTWKIQIADNMIAVINGAAQLNADLPTYPIGDDIMVMLLAEKGTSRAGRQFSDFLISTPDSPRPSEPHTVIEKVQKRDRVES